MALNVFQVETHFLVGLNGKIARALKGLGEKGGAWPNHGQPPTFPQWQVDLA